MEDKEHLLMRVFTTAVGLAAPWPSALIAATSKRYVVFGVRPAICTTVAVKCVFATSVEKALVFVLSLTNTA